MNKNKSQSGSLHILIIVVLTAALLGSLGFIFWQNFINKSGQTTSDNTVVQTKEAEFKTYTTDKYNISFQYPSAWSLVDDKNVANGYYHKGVDIKNADGIKIANFAVGMQVGGMCESQPTYTVLESVPTTFDTGLYVGSEPTTIKATLSFTVTKLEDGSYSAHYGLTDEYTKLGDTKGLCPFYYKIDPKVDGIVGLAFGNDVIETKQFSSLDEAKQYLASDEYAQIKKMILSLKY